MKQIVRLNESELKGIIKEAVDNLMAESVINEWNPFKRKKSARQEEEDKWYADYQARQKKAADEREAYHNQRMTQELQNTRAREQQYKKNAPQWVRDIWDGYYANLNGISTSDVRAAQREGLLSQDQAMEAQRVINNMLNKRAGL